MEKAADAVALEEAAQELAAEAVVEEAVAEDLAADAVADAELASDLAAGRRGGRRLAAAHRQQAIRNRPESQNVRLNEVDVAAPLGIGLGGNHGAPSTRLRGDV